VFATLPHAHSYGREISSKIIRNGQEVEYLVNNKYYDFKYQFYNFNENPITLKMGDQLKTTCVYSTTHTDKFVHGGFTSKDEMCYVFLWYYPKNPNLSYCSEQIPKKSWKTFLMSLHK
jgi:dopamine beta-monooxygenase